MPNALLCMYAFVDNANNVLTACNFFQPCQTVDRVLKAGFDRLRNYSLLITDEVLPILFIPFHNFRKF